MDKFKCDLCPNNCLLTPNGFGKCGNRTQNLGMFSIGSIDKIENRNLYHVYPGTKTLSMGSLGCNLTCPWCQNWSISREHSKFKSNTLRYFKPKELLNLAVSESLNSITFTYNEPIISYEYIVDAAKLFKKHGIKTYMESCGYISSKYLSSFFENIDAVNIDIKLFNNDRYKSILGGDLDTILNTILFLSKSDTWLEISMLLIPGLNDSTTEITNLASWVFNKLGDSIPLHFKAFHPSYKFKNIQGTTKPMITKAIRVAKEVGLRHVYPDYITGETSSNTYCPSCGGILVDRLNSHIKNNLVDGVCPNPKCGRGLGGLY